MIEGVVAKGVSFVDPGLPEITPARIQCVVALGGSLVGKEESGLHLMSGKDGGNQRCGGHVASIERKVERPCAGRGGFCNGSPMRGKDEQSSGKANPHCLRKPCTRCPQPLGFA